MARIMDIRGICIASVVLQTVIFGSGSAFTKLGVKSALEAYWMLETIGVVEKGAGRSRD